MADITSETVAPEMLPPSQYDFASSIKAMHNLIEARGMPNGIPITSPKGYRSEGVFYINLRYFNVCLAFLYKM